MDAASGAHHEIAVPASIFATLRHELAKEAGVLPTIHALHASGYSAGVAAASAFRTFQDEDVLSLPQRAFWVRLNAFFTRRGWGTLTHVPRHQAVGLLTSFDWVEGAERREEEGASCSFSARGDEACSFAFGAAAAIHELYGQLLEGAELDGALAAL